MVHNIPVEDLVNEDDSVISVKIFKPESKEERSDRRRRDRHGDTHPVKHMSPWDRIDKILKKYIGKPFDDAFSYYCKQVPVYQQHIFIEYFSPDHYRWADTYYINEDGIIQKGTRRWRAPKKAIFYSDDYKTELRHKKTGKKKPESHWYYPFTYNNYKEKYPRAKSYHEAQTAYDNEFTPVIVSGWAKEYDSKKDPEYKRLTMEQRKRQEIARKAKEKEEKSKAYSFVHTTPEDKSRQEYENFLKIKRKGFDPDTSFHKQPEE